MLKSKLALLLLLLSFTTTQAVADSVFTHAIIKLPFVVQVEEPWSRVITSQEQWQQFYGENKSYNTAIPNPLIAPDIDFNLYTVVVGGLSWRYSHTDIVVQSISSSSNKTYLSIALLSPGSHCTVTANVTYPNIAVLLPKPAGELNLYTLDYVHDCPA